MRGAAGFGPVWRGMARYGWARRGEAGSGEAGRGVVWLGAAGRGMAWCGLAWLGLVSMKAFIEKEVEYVIKVSIPEISAPLRFEQKAKRHEILDVTTSKAEISEEGGLIGVMTSKNEKYYAHPPSEKVFA